MRADLTDPRMPDWRKYLFPCDGNDAHFLLFEWWDDEGGDVAGIENDFPATLDVVPCVYSPRFRDRVRAAFQVLRGRKVYAADSVLIYEHTARQLRATLDEYLSFEERRQAWQDAKRRKEENGDV